MASSWAVETDENVYYTKLCRLIYDGGSTAVRSLFDGICPAASLAAKLNTWKPKLQKLKKPKGRILSTEQWDKLYPPRSNPKSEDFDITLLFVLLRNICGLKPPAITGWDALPSTGDITLEANLARIKHYRNTVIAHSSKAEVGRVKFGIYWNEISAALRSLGLKQEDMNELKDSPLGTKDYKKLLNDWYMDDQDIKVQLLDIKSDTAEIKDTLHNLEIAQTKRDSPVEKLHDSNFTSEIRTRCESFSPSSRQWILDEVDAHVTGQHRTAHVMVIKAGPGMGKTMVAAKICQIYEEHGILGGCHFFQYSNSLRNDPRLMFESIAKQLCDAVPGYREALETKLHTIRGRDVRDLTCEELFTVLFEEPFSHLTSERNFVIVIDALDECDVGFKEELLHVLETKLSSFPLWIRLVFTTRHLPSSVFTMYFKNETEINPKDPRNLDDLKTFFNKELVKLYPHSSVQELSGKLVEMSKGLFLVAFYVIKLLKGCPITSAYGIVNDFPDGLSSVYKYYFSRLQQVLGPYIRTPGKDTFFKMLSAMAAAQIPLPINIFHSILDLKSESETIRSKRSSREDALQLLHTIFPIEVGHVTVFHKSAIDWLKQEKHKFRVSEEDGHAELSRKCLDVLFDIRNGNKEVDSPLLLTDCEKYAVRRGLSEHIPRSSSVHSEIFSNTFILAAIIYTASVDRMSIARYHSELLGHINKMVKDHYAVANLTFGQFLASVLQLAHGLGVTRELTPKPSDLLMRYHFPYYDVMYLSSVSSSTLIFNKGDERQFLYKNGFVSEHSGTLSGEIAIAVYSYKVGGDCVAQHIFRGLRVMCLPPDNQFLVLAEESGRKIKVVNVTTLDDVIEYACPRDYKIATCHVYGNEQWYIVLRYLDDDKIYIIEGLTGRVHHTITVDKDDRIEGPSKSPSAVCWDSCSRKCVRYVFYNLNL
ncbi:hypothetical protein QZH41_005261 [Actinostola sp. cb2023]|nr:hypothetical protein QZH41_005261 [Actinostola sp. cb2023]